MEEREYYLWLGNKVRELRKKAKMTQKEVAEKAGIYQQDLSAFESRGEKIRSAEKINALLGQFGFELAISEKKTSLNCA